MKHVIPQLLALLCLIIASVCMCISIAHDDTYFSVAAVVSALVAGIILFK